MEAGRAASGITKGRLAAYCAEAAELMLPHLRGRALPLLRAPAGVGGKGPQIVVPARVGSRLGDG